MSGSAQNFRQWLGYDAPKLHPYADEEESVVVDFPEYDIRRLIASRDPLCCLFLKALQLWKVKDLVLADLSSRNAT